MHSGGAPFWSVTGPIMAGEVAAEVFGHPIGVAAPGLVTNLREESQGSSSAGQHDVLRRKN
ncbi:hypothetical protein ACVW19_002457 [Streptomyces sp. TE5632]